MPLGFAKRIATMLSSADGYAAAVLKAPAGSADPAADPVLDRELGWLPEKDRPVLAATIRLRCDALVTGDRTHLGAGYGRAFGGMTIHSPRALAADHFR